MPIEVAGYLDFDGIVCQIVFGSFDPPNLAFNDQITSFFQRIASSEAPPIVCGFANLETHCDEVERQV